MSESIALLCRERPRLEHPPEGGQVFDTTELVTGVELADGTLIEGFWNQVSFLHGKREPYQVLLDWPSDKAERFVDFFERHMVRPPDECPPANCHSFVAAVMGWEVFWKKGYPFNMPTGGQADPERLENGQPYALAEDGKLLHSVLGTSDPTRNVSVWGYREYMLVASNEITAAHHHTNEWLHHVPQTLTTIGRLCARAQGFSSAM